MFQKSSIFDFLSFSYSKRRSLALLLSYFISIKVIRYLGPWRYVTYISEGFLAHQFFWIFICVTPIQYLSYSLYEPYLRVICIILPKLSNFLNLNVLNLKNKYLKDTLLVIICTFLLITHYISCSLDMLFQDSVFCSNC